MPASMLNYANIGAFILNALITYGITFFPGAQGNEVLSAKYQTLVTPAGYAFSIWGIIFTSELIFSLFQMDSLATVTREKIGWNFVGANISQVVWSLVFAYEFVELSVVAMFAIWYFLLRIVLSSDRGEGNYWLLKFPIDVHAGWITAAFFVNMNLLLVKLHVSPQIQKIAAVLSLITLVATACGFVGLYRNWTVGCVLVWAVTGIAVELGSPKESIATLFSQASIDFVRHFTIAGGVVISVVLAGTLVFKYVQSSTRSTSTGTSESQQPLINES